MKEMGFEERLMMVLAHFYCEYYLIFYLDLHAIF